MNITAKQLRLYAVTDRHWLNGQRLEDVAEELLAAGVTCLQLREKNQDPAEFARMARALKPICARYGVPLILNDAVELAKEVDFFSIGTNDLTQYTLAIDRQNPKLDKFYDAHHPAVLSMIRMTVENAHKAGIWAGICGELGADTSLTKEFLAMGVDELSVSPGSILPIRKIILETNIENR